MCLGMYKTPNNAEPPRTMGVISGADVLEGKSQEGEQEGRQVPNHGGYGGTKRPRSLPGRGESTCRRKLVGKQ